MYVVVATRIDISLKGIFLITSVALILMPLQSVILIKASLLPNWHKYAQA